MLESRDEPACGSDSAIVPIHSPVRSFGRYASRSAADTAFSVGPVRPNPRKSSSVPAAAAPPLPPVPSGSGPGEVRREPSSSTA